MDCPVYIEDSGYKGRHCWFFFEKPIEAKEARGLAKSILKRVGEPPQNIHREIFPKQDTISSDALGSVIKLPLGLHKASNRRSLFVDSNGNPYPNQLQVLREIKLINQDDIQRMKEFLQAGLTRAAEEPSDDVKKIISGCRVLRFLVNKAKETGDLSHTERLVILYSFGHLNDKGKQYIHQVMSFCLNYNQRYTERWIRRLKPDIKPISCAKIRDWLSDITPGIGCYCEFKLGKRAYPSPVLHARTETTTGARDLIPPLKPIEGPISAVQMNESKASISLAQELKEYIHIKGEIRGLSNRLEEVEKRLNAYFDSNEVDSLPTELGLLRRIKREDKNSWVIEI